MDKCGDPPTPNSSYASIDDNGHLQVLMNPENPTVGESPLGEGINSDSRRYFDNVFELCNQGKEPACVYIEDDGSWPTVPDGEIDAGERRVDFYLNGFRDESLVGSDNALLLDVGDCICVGLVTRSFGLSEGDELLGALDDTVRIIADTDGDCVSPDCANITAEIDCYTPPTAAEDDWPNSTTFRVENIGDLTQTRLDTVRNIDDYTDFENAFEPDDPGTLDVPADACIAEIDFSAFTIETTADWENGDVGIPEC